MAITKLIGWRLSLFVFPLLLLASGRTLAASWQEMDSTTSADLHAVWGFSNTDVYAVGSGATLLHFDGTNWSTVTTGLESSYPVSVDFTAVYGRDNQLYVAGTQGWAMRKARTSWEQMFFGTSKPFRSIWAGPNSWTVPNAELVYFFTANEGFSYSPASQVITALVYRDGTSFSTTPPASFQGAGGYLDGDTPKLINTTIPPYEGLYVDRKRISTLWQTYSVWAVSKNDIFVLGDGTGSSKRNTSGNPGSTSSADWVTIDPILHIGYDIWGTENGAAIYAVGRNQFGSGGGITFFDGTDWSVQQQSTNSLDYLGVHGFAVDDVFVVGEGGKILRSQLGDTSVEISELRAVQTVLNTQTDDLVAGKDLVLQVVAASNAPGEDTTPVTVRLCPNYDLGNDACIGNSWLEEHGDVYPDAYPFDPNEYGNAKDAINFQIIGDDANNWLTPGPLTFKAELYLNEDIAGEPDASMHRTLNFRETQSLKILVVKVKARPDENTPAVWPDEPATDEDMGKKAIEILKVLFPVDEQRVSSEVKSYVDDKLEPIVVTLGNIAAADINGLFFDIESQLMKEAQVNSAADKVLALLVVNDSSHGEPMLWKYKNGKKKSIDGVAISGSRKNAENGLFSSYPVVISIDRTADTDDIFYDISSIAPHEIGHLYGLGEEYCNDGVGKCPERTEQPNPPPTNTDEGRPFGNFVLQTQRAYDTRDELKAVFRRKPFEKYNALGYMGAIPLSYQWSGNEEYEHLFRLLCKSCPEKKQQVNSLQSIEQSREVINLLGSIAEDGRTTLDSLFVINTNLTLAPLTGDEYSVRFQDTDGNLLKEEGFEVISEAETRDSSGNFHEPLTEPLFVISTPLPQLTKLVSVYRGEDKLLQVEKSPNKPEVAITTLQKVNDNQLKVDWTAADLDRDELKYSLFYSPDGTRQNLVYSDLLEESATFDLVSPDGTGPTAAASITVSASDGFNSGEHSVLLNLGDATDRVSLKRYNTRGPNIPGMCSRKNCVASKTHTLVATNPHSEEGVMVDLELVLATAPDPACTVNDKGPGDPIYVATAVYLEPDSTTKHNIEITFECPNSIDLSLQSNFVLEATVKPYALLDPISTNNTIVRSQTVR